MCVCECECVCLYVLSMWDRYFSFVNPLMAKVKSEYEHKTLNKCVSVSVSVCVCVCVCTRVCVCTVLTYIVLHLCVVFVHELQQPQLNLGLVQEGFLVLDDLDGHPL